MIYGVLQKSKSKISFSVSNLSQRPLICSCVACVDTAARAAGLQVWPNRQNKTPSDVT